MTCEVVLTQSEDRLLLIVYRLDENGNRTDEAYMAEQQQQSQQSAARARVPSTATATRNRTRDSFCRDSARGRATEQDRPRDQADPTVELGSTTTAPARTSTAPDGAEVERKSLARQRERCRQNELNNAYDLLRDRLPPTAAASGLLNWPDRSERTAKLPKLETLRLAIEYIRRLEDSLRQGRQQQDQVGGPPGA